MFCFPALVNGTASQMNLLLIFVSAKLIYLCIFAGLYPALPLKAQGGLHQHKLQKYTTKCKIDKNTVKSAKKVAYL